MLSIPYRNEKCSELAIDKCIFGMSARLNFAHIDEETRQLLFSSKMSDRVSDCDGIMCTISVLRKTVGGTLFFDPLLIIQKLKEKEMARYIQRSIDGFSVSSGHKSMKSKDVPASIFCFLSKTENIR